MERGSEVVRGRERGRGEVKVVVRSGKEGGRQATTEAHGKTGE